MGILDRILRAGEGKKLKALEGLLPDINALESTVAALSDDAIRFTSPVDSLLRVASRDTVLAGCPVGRTDHRPPRRHALSVGYGRPP